MELKIFVNLCPTNLLLWVTLLSIIVQDCGGLWKLSEKSVSGFESLFEKQASELAPIGASRAGLEDDTISCFCEGFINGPYHAKASCMDQLYCEPKSTVKCSKIGGCLKNSYTVQGMLFVIKFCGDSREDGEGCKVRRANSTVFGSVELTECICKEEFCNGQLPSVRKGNYGLLFLIVIIFYFV